MKYNAADFLLQYFHSQYHFKSIHHEKHPFIVGSLRKDSFNRQLAKEAENYLAGKAEITHLDYTDVPFVNQDIEYPAPAAVVQTELDCVVNQYTDKFLNPMVMWGKYRKRWFKATLPVSFQFHHVQMDGGDAARFLERLQGVIGGL